MLLIALLVALMPVAAPDDVVAGGPSGIVSMTNASGT
jgi:hypothetical protein